MLYWVFTSSLLLNIYQIETKTSQNSALLVVGGLSRISVDRVDDHGRAMSPILGAAELFNCPHSANSSIKLPDYPLEMFGGQSIFLGDKLLVCGGANWTTSYTQCYSWSNRHWTTWHQAGSLNFPRAFGFMTYLPDPICKTDKLFIIGGLDSVNLTPVLTTEVYDEENQTWMIHKQLPSTSDKNIFVNRADSGCISTMDGVVYSVGKEVISMDWISLSLKVLTKTKQSALAEGCVGITLSSGDIGFFFLSGDFYNLRSETWTTFSKPEPAFNIFSIDNVPIILGIAALDNKCTGHNNDCHRRMLAGDNRVVQFNIQSNTWTNIGHLEHARLGYSSAVEIPQFMCYPSDVSQLDHSITNKTLVKYLPAAVVAENDVEQENEEDFGRVSNKSSLPLRDETSLKLYADAVDVNISSSNKLQTQLFLMSIIAVFIYNFAKF